MGLGKELHPGTQARRKFRILKSLFVHQMGPDQTLRRGKLTIRVEIAFPVSFMFENTEFAPTYHGWAISEKIEKCSATPNHNMG